MSASTRIVFLALNLFWGASMGVAAALVANDPAAWTGEPSQALLAAGCVVVFGGAYLVTVTARGQRPTLRGFLAVAGGFAACFGFWSLTVSAPAWVIVWTVAAVAGAAAGVVRPLPERRERRAPRDPRTAER